MEKDFYISLIYKNLKGIASSEEKALLQSTTSESKANAQLREEVEWSWQLSQQEEKLPFEIDVESDLTAVRKKLQRQNQVQTQISSSNSSATATSNSAQDGGAKVVPLWRRLSVAASLLLLIGAGAWAVNFFARPSLTTLETGAMAQQFKLKDGSEVWLNKESKLTFQDGFQPDLREVALDGEAFFDVERNEAAPFVIKTQNSTVTVLGTSFNVKETSTATTVSVKSGRVRVEGDGEQVELTKGEQATHTFAERQIKKSASLTENDWAWKTGRFIFKSQPIRLIVSQLEQNFNIKIQVENAEMLNCEISAVLSAKDQKTVLEKLAQTTKMKLTQTGDSEFLFKGGSCE